jgi:subtilisin-like proprotein convertase family protein
MKLFLRSLTVWLGTLASTATWAQVTETTNYSVGLSIPDNNASGLSSTVAFDSSQIYQITDVEVSLTVSGGFNGDYYAYLTHDTGFAVLLNRVGRDAGSLFGYPDGGLSVLLDDQAPNGDIHVYRSTLNPNGGTLTGMWAPDARTEDPASVLSTSSRSAYLASFSGLNPNGAWTLFIADLEPGSVGTLEGWGLTVTGVPEPSTLTLLLLTSAVLIGRKPARKANGQFADRAPQLIK